MRRCSRLSSCRRRALRLALVTAVARGSPVCYVTRSCTLFCSTSPRLIVSSFVCATRRTVLQWHIELSFHCSLGPDIMCVGDAPGRSLCLFTGWLNCHLQLCVSTPTVFESRSLSGNCPRTPSLRDFAETHRSCIPRLFITSDDTTLGVLVRCPACADTLSPQRMAESAAISASHRHRLQSARTSRERVSLCATCKGSIGFVAILHTLLEAASLQGNHSAAAVRDKRDGCCHMAVLPGRITPTPTLKYKDTEPIRACTMLARNANILTLRLACHLTQLLHTPPSPSASLQIP
jgi:hypothetical protein